MLDGECGEVGVGHEVARRSEVLEELPQHDVVPLGRVEDDDRRLRQPAAHQVERLGGCEWTLEHGGSRAQAEKREQRSSSL